MRYDVKPGDTLQAISKRLHVSVRILARQNHIRHPDRISVGMRLDVPTLGHGMSGGAHTAQHDRSETTPGLPLSTADRSPSSGTKLGDLSMRYETHYEPGQEYLAAAVVSSGRKDPGGVSYGAYQLNSRKGDKVRDFLSNEGAPWFNRFQGLDETIPGGEFGKTWKTIAQESPQSFFEAQHAYIKRTNYGKTIRKVEKNTGIDLDSMSIAVRNVAWSVSVQHGGAALILERALRDLNATDINGQRATTPGQPAGLAALAGNGTSRFSSFIFNVAISQFERDLILAIYKERRHYIRADAHMDAGNVAALDSRYEREQRDALQELQSR